MFEENEVTQPATPVEHESLFKLPTPRSHTGFRGVCWHKGKEKYVAQVSVNGKSHYMGQFDTARQAAEIYDARARQLLGPKAPLNFPKEGEVSAFESPARRGRKPGSRNRPRIDVPHAEASAKTIDALRQLLTLKNFLMSLTPEQHELLMEL